MADCPACGAPITHAKTETGAPVPLEKYTEPQGPRRFRIVRTGPPIVVAPVGDLAVIDAHPDHRLDCPDYDNGLPSGR